MTIRELSQKVTEVSTDKRKEAAIEALEDFIYTGIAINKQFNADVDYRDIISMVLCGAIAADGDVGDSEYELYTGLCDSLDLPPRAMKDLQEYADHPDQVVEIFTGLVGKLKPVFNNLGQAEAFDNFAFGVACIVFDDDSAEDGELDLLKCFVDGAGNSSASGSASSNFASTNSHENIKLVDYEASFSRDDDRYYFTIGAELKNPNLEYCARNVNVKVIVMDSSGRILETSENTIDYIDSNATFYYGDEFSIDRGVPANYRVQVNCDEFVSAPANSTFADGITCSHYNVSTNRWGSTEFTGNVHNGYNKKLYVDLYFVFTNSSGKITGGTNTRVTLYGNSDDAFDVYLNTQVKRDKVRCSPTFDFMDLVD